METLVRLKALLFYEKLKALTMRAIILAAGKGTRLRPITNHTPKPLVRVKDRPLIEHQIIKLKNAGVDTIVVNLHYLGEQIKQHLLAKPWGVNLLFSEEDMLLNTGGGIVHALPLLGQEPFLVVSGDVFTDYPYDQLTLQDNALAHLVFVPNPNFHHQGDFGLDKGTVYLDGKERVTYANIGLYHPDFFKSAPKGPFPLLTLLKAHIDAKKVTGELYLGPWHNIGTETELQEAELS